MKAILRAAAKMFVFISAVMTYFVAALTLYPSLKKNPMQARKKIARLISAYARFACWFMGIIVSLKGAERLKQGNNLIVSNHLSYTDILVICSYFPACFVTSVEMRDTPFLGHICKLAGCVFVERRNKKNLGNEVKEITDALKAGLDVVIFPEATSTNGEEVIRFRRPLFRSAIDSQIPVKPLTLNYRALDNVEVSLRNRDEVFWYGDMTFVDHLWNFFKHGEIAVDLWVGEDLKIGDEVDHGILAEQSHAKVKSHYRQVLA